MDVACPGQLTYVTDATPGIRRRRAGLKFRYVAPDGVAIREADTLRRIRSLAIPPAWRDVWICADADGHIQATGRDARGRKQYRYHPLWRTTRDGAKYGRLVAFGEALPRLRERVDGDLRRPGLPRDKVLALVVSLLDRTLIRVGNEEYAKANGSVGLTTMRDRHVDIHGAEITFRFRGKSGRKHSLSIRDRRLAAAVKRCRDIPGQVLFQYVAEDGSRQSVGSADVNGYLRAAMGADFSAKDFRTWAGTVLAATALASAGPPCSERDGKREVVAAVAAVAERLGNTPAVCRKCYVHPDVIEAYFDGDLGSDVRRGGGHGATCGLADEEAAVLRLLRRRTPQGDPGAK